MGDSFSTAPTQGLGGDAHVQKQGDASRKMPSALKNGRHPLDAARDSAIWLALSYASW